MRWVTISSIKFFCFENDVNYQQKPIGRKGNGEQRKPMDVNLRDVDVQSFLSSALLFTFPAMPPNRYIYFFNGYLLIEKIRYY